MEEYLFNELSAFDMITMTLYTFGILAAFLIGVSKICIRRSSPLYFKLMIYAVGCLALESLGSFVSCICTGYIQYLRVSNLSYVACYVFIVSANVGALDRITDENGSNSLKVKLLALIAPIVFIVLDLGVVFYDGSIESFNIQNFLWIIQDIPMFIGSYFCLKQLFLPPDEMGFLKATRPVNIAILIYNTVVSLTYYSTSNISANILSMIIILLIFGIVFAVIKGEKIWKTLV